MEHVWQSRQRRMQQRAALGIAILLLNILGFAALAQAPTKGSSPAEEIAAVGFAMFAIEQITYTSNDTLAVSLGAVCFPLFKNWKRLPKIQQALFA